MIGRHRIFASLALALALAASGLLQSVPRAAAEPQPACVNPELLSSTLSTLQPYSCVELGRETLEGRTMRVLRDKKMSPDLAGKFTTSILQAAHSSLTTYKALRGSLQIGDVTFVLTNKTSGAGGETMAGPDHGEKITDPKKKNATEEDKECVIAIYVNSFDINDKEKDDAELKQIKQDRLSDDTKFVIAHELFHCIQFWNYPAEMSVFVAKTGGKWWVEGTADYMATLVYPEGEKFHLWLSGFDNAIGKKSLISLSYENYVFFAWLAHAKGVTSIFDFMAVMPPIAHQEFMAALPYAQIKAATGFVTEEGLQQFARDYVDGKINGARGEHIDKANLGQPLYVHDDTVTQNTAGPFTLLRGQINFSGGTYDVTIKPNKETGPQYKKPKDSGDDEQWEKTMDAKVNAPCTKSVAYRYAGFNSSNAGQWVTISATKDKDSPSCVACVDLGSKDQCVVGEWQVNNAVLETLLGGQLKGSKVTAVSGTGSYRFDKSGNGKIVINNTSIMAQSNDSRALVTVSADGNVTGRWSSKGDKLRFCPTAGALPIKVKATIFAPSAVTTTTTHNYELDPMDFTFNCGGASLRLKSEAGKFANGAPPQWDMSRTK